MLTNARRALRSLFTVGLAVGLAGPALADENDSPEPTVLQQRDDRLIVELPNRMIAIAQEIPTAPVVSAQIWVKTGSIYEQEFVGAGISHYLEHMLSGGTTSTRSEAESNAILGRMGARTNAATGLDNVRYFINTTSEHTAEAVDLLSDWIRNGAVEQSEVDREHDVILQEFSMGEGDPGRILWRLTQQARYTAHPARHPTIGYIDEFKQIDRDELYEFYQRMYPPNNLVMVVAGDIDKDAVIQQIAEFWSDAEPRELPELSFPVEPELEEPRELTGRADISRPRIRLAWPGTRLGGDYDYALDVLGTILGQGETSRLVRKVRDDERMVNSISAYNLSFDWGEGFFGIDAEIADFDLDGRIIDIETGEPMSPDELPANAHEESRAGFVQYVVLGEVQRITEDGVTDAELARAKRRIMAQVASANQTAEGVASRLARDVIGTGDPDYLQRYADAIQELTPEDIQQAAMLYLSPDRLVTVRLLPYDDEHGPTPLARPSDEQDLDAFEQESIDLDNARTVERMREALADREHEATPVEVEPLVQHELDNGIRLLVQRSTVVPAVSMQVFWKGGLLGETPGREGVANAMAQMLMRGTQQRGAQALANAIESLGASMTTQTGNNTTYAQASSLSEDWSTVMNLLAEVLLKPAFDEDEWDRLRPRLLASIAREADSWYGELNKHFRQAYYGNHPWSQSPLGRRDVVEQLTVDDLREFHASQLGGSEMVVSVVGDVDPEEVREKVEELFGSLPAEAPQPFEAAPATTPSEALMQVETRKRVAAVKIGMGPAVDRASEDYAAMLVLSRLMSQFPGGWLNQTLRGDGPGLAYAQWARLVTGIEPGYFEITFNSSPDLVPEALRRSLAVIERAKHGEIGDDELARARAGVLTGEFFGKQSNSDRAMSAALDELYGVHDPEGERFRAAIEAIDAEEIHRVAQKYLINPVTLLLTHERIDEDALNGAPVESVESDVSDE
ncbi:M16 family metallopeptidase [Phycisphaerales bacterium AB-hyl4]|uniref:M16 family metallopeptidase n=1 Tax=Natronomicrosphaera hydrolytica TaxID=3242702 RepID=A0ABV4U4S2_9BACT